MKSMPVGTIAVVAALVTALGSAVASAQQDKYTVKVPGGLAFSEFKGYESWQSVSVSYDNGALAVILANAVMIDAYLAGIPGNGKPFPEGSMLAKVHWVPKQMATFPGATVPARQANVDFMVKDSKRFADSGGWGWGSFERDSATGAFRPGTLSDRPPQGNDAKCGFTCHTIAKARDYVFTEYGGR